ncbi:hypothetical protein BACCAP_01587 [Pseudoflavonifractor capillosus ATCC 29799]|uniref:Uncharacterized protein n=1 Tax=Pseudoflavonifractor capillosus ATCC 29799 TaxID=411467 RepID=A6NTQ8_9FIRM|nr:hypothetical protein BACCAP_01587 [Pseudoflavonifractor capillosus ATCC 29799]
MTFSEPFSTLRIAQFITGFFHNMTILPLNFLLRSLLSAQIPVCCVSTMPGKTMLPWGPPGGV